MNIFQRIFRKQLNKYVHKLINRHAELGTINSSQSHEILGTSNCWLWPKRYGRQFQP